MTTPDLVERGKAILMYRGYDIDIVSASKCRFLHMENTRSTAYLRHFTMTSWPTDRRSWPQVTNAPR